MMTKSKNHWFYVDYWQPDGVEKNLTLKLDKKEYDKVLKSAKEPSGREWRLWHHRRTRSAKPGWAGRGTHSRAPSGPEMF